MADLGDVSTVPLRSFLLSSMGIAGPAWPDVSKAIPDATRHEEGGAGEVYVPPGSVTFG